ncbi:MAG: hypothetical protein ACD_76C00012G0004 [uncultured bacterium]|nr:MAG: hypothetical protein ACD_76C00012G0004 [uncultured bacterium]HBD04944.1 hypothetical protein [Candidatus Uhrbacteria bacterium]
MTHRYRTIFPFVLIILSLGLMLVVALSFAYNKKYAPPAPPSESVAQTISQAQYESAVLEILNKYKSPQDAPTARKGIESLSVPANYKTLHLELVIAFARIEQGVNGDEKNIQEGNDLLEELKRQYSWMAH